MRGGITLKKIIAILLGVTLIALIPTVSFAEDRELMTVTTICNTVEYSGSTVTQGALSYANDGSMALVPRTDDADNQALKMDRPSGNAPSITTYSGVDYKGIYTVSFDIMIPDVTLGPQYFSTELKKESDGSVAWFNNNSFYVDTDGDIKVDGTTYYESIESGEWNSIAIAYDPNTDKAMLYVNGELEATRDVIAFSAVGRMQIGVRAGFCIHIDNVKVYTTGYEYDVTAKAVDAETKAELTDGIDYLNPCVALEFTEVIAEDTVIADNIKLLNGAQEIGSSFEISADKKTVYIIPEDDLIPNKEYKVSVGEGVKTNYGAYAVGGKEMTLRTAKEPFSIKLATSTTVVAGSEFDLTITMNNRENITADAALLACVYDADGDMVSGNATHVTGTADGLTYTVQLLAPEDITDMKVKIFLINNFTALELVDELEL